MADPIDISVRLRAGMPTWPGSVGLRYATTLSIAAGDEATVSRIDMDVHSGTHVEAPLHFLEGGTPLDALPLSTFLGPAYVAHLPTASEIGAEVLQSANVPSGTERLLLRTPNSALWGQPIGFQTDYVALTLEGARWIAERGIKLVGVDYLSVQRFKDGPETHRVLMRQGVAILEGIDLSGVRPGRYRLSCLPIRIAGAEAAPVRAVLEPL